MPETLSPSEIAAITGKRTAKQQAAALVKLGVPFNFHGNRVEVVRVVAQAFALIREPKVAEPIEPAPTPYQPHLNPGLLAWRESRRVSPETVALLAQADATYKANRPGHIAAQRAANRAKRRADELRRIPAWADREAIREVYAEAKRLTRETGIPHHVDHEIPLRGELVSGLHVHNNLKAIPAPENIGKGNRYEVE